MTFEKSLLSVTADIKRAMTIIADNMIKTRPRGAVEYRPFRRDPVWRDAPAGIDMGADGGMTVNFPDKLIEYRK